MEKKRKIFLLFFSTIFSYFFLTFILISNIDNDFKWYNKIHNIKIFEKFNKYSSKTRINIYNYVAPNNCNNSCYGENGEAVILNVYIFYSINMHVNSNFVSISRKMK
jgi:hypothetical protein